MLTFIMIILILVSFSFLYTSFKFIKYRKKRIEHVSNGIDNYLKKYDVDPQNFRIVSSLNMDYSDPSLSNKELGMWIDASSFLCFINSDFEDDLGVVRIDLGRIENFSLVTYQNSEKEDIYLYLNSDDENSEDGVLYFKGESYASFKELLTGKEKN